MNAKLIAGATALTVIGLIGGALLSESVRGSERDENHRSELADLQAQIDDGRRSAERLGEELALTRRRHASRLRSFTEETRTLRESLAEREQELVDLRGAEEGTATDIAGARGSVDVADNADRRARWKELSATIAPVLEILHEMDQEGANHLELGPQMVAALGKLSAEQIDALVAFDVEETDPRIVGDIRAVMLQAMYLMPAATKHRDSFMGRYIDRAHNGGYGESFTTRALRRISFEMPPFYDAYARLVEPLDDDLQERLVQLAIDRAIRGDTDAHRLDGISFLRRVPHRRATEALIDVARQPATDVGLRIAALRGLSGRADVEQAIRDLAQSDQDAAMRAAATELLESSEPSER